MCISFIFSSHLVSFSKTECFIVPIINHLLREAEAGPLEPGVRAILIYPMNALANDQMKRMFIEELAGRLGVQLDVKVHDNPVDPPGEPPTREDIVNIFTLVLFYLTSWEERVGHGLSVMRAWKSADWDALDTLRDAGFISCTNKAKSVTVTEAGAAVAEDFLETLELGHLMRR